MDRRDIEIVSLKRIIRDLVSAGDRMKHDARKYCESERSVANLLGYNGVAPGDEGAVQSWEDAVSGVLRRGLINGSNESGGSHPCAEVSQVTAKQR